MLETLLVILPLFLIIFGSAFLTRIGIADEKWGDVLNDFALKLGFPALIFSAISSIEFSLADNSGLLIANSVLVVGGFLVAYLLGKIFRLSKKMLSTILICLPFGNVAYLGIPTLVQVKGDYIVAEASIIVACYLFWVFTVGTGYLEYTNSRSSKDVVKKVLASIFKNPLLLAVVFGLGFAWFGIQLPQVISKSISMLASSVTPIVLVVIGLFLGHTKFGKLKDWGYVALFSLATLLVLPGLFLLGIQYLNLPTETYWASIVEAAMPLAITPFALVKLYELDEAFIARSIVLSTIISVVTIPFWISLI